MIFAYKCRDCRQTIGDREIFVKHVKECNWKPENKTCYTCKHLSCDQENIHSCDIGIKINVRINKNCEKWLY